MCGIAGFILSDTIPLDESEAILHNANRMQRFRGPDRESIWSDGHVGIAHVQLDILSKDAAVKQPFFDDYGGVLAYNGELYDYASLLENAQPSSAHACQEGTVIAQLLEAHGVQGLQHQRGMFAIVRYVKRRNAILLIRDAYGKKPLYFAPWRSGWAFASTVVALRAFLEALSIREASIYEYLIYRSVGGYHSSWENIEQVPPGGWVELGLNGAIRKGMWHQYPESVSTHLYTPRQTRESLVDAVRARIPPNLPITCFLSGGLDSAIVANECIKQAPSRCLQALSVGYGHETCADETHIAQKFAQSIGFPFQRIELTPKALPQLVATTVKALEDPIQDPVSVATLLLAQFSSQNTRVVLTGDGADEGWGGYARYQNLPSTLEEYWPRLWVFSPQELGLMVAPESYFDEIEFPNQSLPLCIQVSQLEMKVRFRNYHLARLDKIGMYTGLEIRCPFLDPSLLKQALMLENSIKCPNQESKGLMKNIFRNRLPNDITSREKQPFTLPIHHWLKNELKPFVQDLLGTASSFVSGYVPVKALLNQLYSSEAYEQKSASYHPGGIEHKIWSLVMLESWYQETKHWRTLEKTSHGFV